MSSIYVGQTALTFQVRTGIPLTNLNTGYLVYGKPSGATGAWQCSVSDVTNGYLTYGVRSSTDLDEPGKWAMWSRCVFNDGTRALGDVDEVYVKPKPTGPR